MAKKPEADKLEVALELADRYVMNLCEPGKMSPDEAIVFLERVCGRCEAAIEALREENDSNDC